MENHGWRRVDSRGKQSAEDPKINLSARVARREYDDGRTRKQQQKMKHNGKEMITASHPEKDW